MPFLDFSQFCSFCHCLIEASKLIHELNLYSVCAQPYVALRDFLNLFGSHLAAVSHALSEQCVSTAYIRLQNTHLFCGHRTGLSAESTVLVRFHLIEFHSEFLCEQAAHVGEHSEDSDTAGER